MHSKVLVVDLGEIARVGQDHCSALAAVIEGEAVVRLCVRIYTKPQPA